MLMRTSPVLNLEGDLNIYVNVLPLTEQQSLPGLVQTTKTMLWPITLPWSLNTPWYFHFGTFPRRHGRDRRCLALRVDLSSLSAVSCAYVACSRGADCWQSKLSRIVFQRLLHLTDLYSSLSFHVRASAAVSSRTWAGITQRYIQYTAYKT